MCVFCIFSGRSPVFYPPLPVSPFLHTLLGEEGRAPLVGASRALSAFCSALLSRARGYVWKRCARLRCAARCGAALRSGGLQCLGLATLLCAAHRAQRDSAVILMGHYFVVVTFQYAWCAAVAPPAATSRRRDAICVGGLLGWGTGASDGRPRRDEVVILIGACSIENFRNFFVINRAGNFLTRTHDLKSL